MTVSECIAKGQRSKTQVAVDQVFDLSEKNLFQLNGDKTKELTVTFSHNSSKFPRALIAWGYYQLKLNLERSHRRSCEDSISQTVCLSLVKVCADSTQRSSSILLCVH